VEECEEGMVEEIVFQMLSGGEDWDDESRGEWTRGKVSERVESGPDGVVKVLGEEGESVSGEGMRIKGRPEEESVVLHCWRRGRGRGGGRGEGEVAINPTPLSSFKE
jgi:hypothetical protein